MGSAYRNTTVRCPFSSTRCSLCHFTARADHTDTVEDLTARGRDTESQVLARAVKWHSEHRVLLNGHRTVVFR